MAKRMTLEEAAETVRRCIGDIEKRRQIEWIRLMQGDQFANLIEQYAKQQKGKKK